MKRLLLLFITCLFSKLNSYGQSFLNGSFETHSLSICSPTLTDAQFNNNIDYVMAFGKTITPTMTYNNHYGTCGIIDSACPIVPQNGKWCLSMHSSFGSYPDKIALELDSTLNPGTLYYLSFYVYGNYGWRNFECSVDIGESLYDSTLGNYIYTATPDFLNWKNISFQFTAQDTSKYITLKMLQGFNAWNQFDNFIISRSPIPLGIGSYEAPGFFSLYPNPANTHLTLNFANDPEPCVVELFNELGQPVLKKQVVQSPEITLDLSSLAAGFYSVRATNSRTTFRRKLVVSR